MEITLMLISIMLLILTIWYIRFHLTRRRIYELAAEFDGPRALPIVGNALECLIPSSEMVDAVINGSLNYKSPIRFWFGSHLAIYIWDPSNIKIVLNSTRALDKPSSLYGIVEDIAGRGIGTVPVEEWKIRRKLLGPCLQTNIFEKLFDKALNHADILVKTVKDEEDKGFFDIHKYLVKCTIDIILETQFGFNNYLLDGRGNHIIMELMKAVLNSMVLKVTNVLYLNDFLYKMSSASKKLEKAKLEWNIVMDSILHSWKEKAKYIGVKDKVQSNEEEFVKPKGFMEHLLTVSDQFTQEEIRGEINNIIIAGFETSSTLLGFFLIMLGIHPEIQEKVYQEVVHVLGDRTRLEFKDLHHLHYMKMVFKETLRIFPPILLFARVNDEELKLEKHTIPANTTILIGALSAHRDPTIWPNPTKFDPDRFLPEEEAKRNPYSWIPFSAGPRNCLGMKFGWNIIKVIGGNLILNYKVQTPYKSVEDIHIAMFVALQPTNGFKISVTPRC